MGLSDALVSKLPSFRFMAPRRRLSTWRDPAPLGKDGVTCGRAEEVEEACAFRLGRLNPDILPITLFTFYYSPEGLDDAAKSYAHLPCRLGKLQILYGLHRRHRVNGRNLGLLRSKLLHNQVAR